MLESFSVSTCVIDAKTFARKARDRLRWIDELEDDMRKLKVNNWKGTAKDRDK